MVKKIGIKNRIIDISGSITGDIAAALVAVYAAITAHAALDTGVHGAGASTLATLADLVVPDYAHTSICLYAYTGSVGTWQVKTITGSYVANISNDTDDNGDYLEWEVWLPAGNYTAEVFGYTYSNAGITDFKVEGVEKGTKNWYSAGIGYTVYTFTFTVAVTGAQTIRMILDGKHASSTDHIAYIDSINIGRTS